MTALFERMAASTIIFKRQGRHADDRFLLSSLMQRVPVYGPRLVVQAH
jgi:hypothetical protein